MNAYGKLIAMTCSLWLAGWVLGSAQTGDKCDAQGCRQVSMALTSWATHTLQWPVQRAAKPRGGANPLKPVSVRIAGCNSPA